MECDDTSFIGDDYFSYFSNSGFQLPVATVGKIPTSIFSDTRLELGSLQLSAFQDILVPSISIAMLGMIESLLCGASAGRMTGKPLDSNQELVAQGIGNLILPFFRWRACDGSDCPDERSD